MKLLFVPISILGGVLAGLLGTKIFERVWGLIDEQEPPAAKHREVQYGKLAAALLLEGAIFRLVRGFFDHGARRGFRRLVAGPGRGKRRPSRSSAGRRSDRVRTAPKPRGFTDLPLGDRGNTRQKIQIQEEARMATTTRARTTSNARSRTASSTRSRNSSNRSNGGGRSSGGSRTQAKGSTGRRSQKNSSRARPASAGSSRRRQADVQKTVSAVASKAKNPLVAGGAALMGLAGGVAISRNGSGKKLLGVRMPQIGGGGSDEEGIGRRHQGTRHRAAKELGKAGFQAGQLTSEVRRVREP